MTAPLFRLQGVAFAYEPDRPVLSGADFTVRAGEKIGLVGSNGAGKTTLFHLMVGLLAPQAGTIEAFGQIRARERDFHGVRARAGLLFQDSEDQLFCPTVAEDVAFGPLNLGRARQEAARDVARTLASLGLEGFENRVTHKLSGGQKRLVALATVLAMRPQALLLDEPTTGLDGQTRERLIAILAALPQAMVIISHDPDVLDRLVERRVALRGGRLEDDASQHGPMALAAPSV